MQENLVQMEAKLFDYAYLGNYRNGRGTLYNTDETLDIWEDAQKIGNDVLRVLAEGGRPYSIDEDLQQREGIDGKYVPTGRGAGVYLSRESHDDVGKRVEVALHEYMHAVLARNGRDDGTRDEEDVEKDVDQLLEDFLMENRYHQDATVRELAEKAYKSHVNRQLSPSYMERHKNSSNSDDDLGSIMFDIAGDALSPVSDFFKNYAGYDPVGGTVKHTKSLYGWGARKWKKMVAEQKEKRERRNAAA